MNVDQWGKVRLVAICRLAPDAWAIAVYAYLCAHADPRGRTFVGVDAIAGALETSESTVRRRLRVLKDSGEIEDHPKGGLRIVPEGERSHVLSRLNARSIS